MIISLNGTVGRAVQQYTGTHINWVDVYPDPNVPGVFAVRAQQDWHHTGTETTIDFLIRVPLQKVTAADLEECEFTTWPPVMVKP